MKTKKVLKSDRELIPSRWLIASFLRDNNLSTPVTIKVCYRVGKKKKIKSLRVVALDSHPCECCGEHNYLTYEKNGKSHSTEIF